MIVMAVNACVSSALSRAVLVFADFLTNALAGVCRFRRRCRLLLLLECESGFVATVVVTVMRYQGADKTAEGADKMKTAMAHNLMNFRCGLFSRVRLPLLPPRVRPPEHGLVRAAAVVAVQYRWPGGQHLHVRRGGLLEPQGVAQGCRHELHQPASGVWCEWCVCVPDVFCAFVASNRWCACLLGAVGLCITVCACNMDVALQRERKKNYDVNEYYRDVLGGAEKKPIVQAKMVRLPQMYDYQFFDRKPIEVLVDQENKLLAQRRDLRNAVKVRSVARAVMRCHVTWSRCPRTQCAASLIPFNVACPAAAAVDQGVADWSANRRQ